VIQRRIERWRWQKRSIVKPREAVRDKEKREGVKQMSYPRLRRKSASQFVPPSLPWSELQNARISLSARRKRRVLPKGQARSKQYQMPSIDYLELQWPESLTRLLRPRLPPSGRWARTSRSWGSSLSLSVWWTRTCLQLLLAWLKLSFFRSVHTFAGCLASDTCARGLDKTGIRIQVTDAQAHVVSFHSCVWNLCHLRLVDSLWLDSNVVYLTNARWCASCISQHLEFWQRWPEERDNLLEKILRLERCSSAAWIVALETSNDMWGWLLL